MDPRRLPYPIWDDGPMAGRNYGWLSPQDYEARYVEALEVIRTKILNVGQPETTPNGIRVVRVGAKRCDDQTVFTLASQFAQVALCRGGLASAISDVPASGC